jgi:integrase/recombinase XerC
MAAAQMNPPDWIDTAATPPRRLPDTVGDAIAYLADALGHVVHVRWTLVAIKRRYPSLADAKAAHPAVMRLLLDHPAAVEYWDRGRVRTVAADAAPAPETILARVLQTHRRRFRGVTDPGLPAPKGELERETGLPAMPSAMLAWLARAGRFANAAGATNTLGVGDDAQAVALFLRDRASRSPHTLRAYRTELRRLVAWCDMHGLGPLSDLTRHDLLAYRQALRRPPQEVSGDGQRRKVSEATQARALAIVASLFRYWTETGYLSANPGAGLVRGARPRASFVSQRMLPTALMETCDAWVAEVVEGDDALVVARRRAIWTLYRYAGVRLVELVWSDEAQLPRLEADDDGSWTLHVLGKGRKTRAVPLPAVCVPILRAYRQLRGLTAQPGSVRARRADPWTQGRLATQLGALRRGEGDLRGGRRPRRDGRPCGRRTPAAGIAALVAACVRPADDRRPSGASAGGAGAARARIDPDDGGLRENRSVATAWFRRAYVRPRQNRWSASDVVRLAPWCRMVDGVVRRPHVPATANPVPMAPDTLADDAGARFRGSGCKHQH